MERAQTDLFPSPALAPQLKFLGINNQDEGYIFTDPSIINDTTTEATQLGSQFDKLLAGLFPLFTPEEIQSVAAQYPISDAPSTGNTFNRISNIIADSTFVCPVSLEFGRGVTMKRNLTFGTHISADILDRGSVRLVGLEGHL